MTTGLGLLWLHSKDFWAMTPRELAAAMGMPRPAMERTTLETLMKEFPDG